MITLATPQPGQDATSKPLDRGKSAAVVISTPAAGNIEKPVYVGLQHNATGAPLGHWDSLAVDIRITPGAEAKESKVTLPPGCKRFVRLLVHASPGDGSSTGDITLDVTK